MCENEGILVSLTGNFLGYPKAPSTPLINLSSYFTSSVSSCVVTWWILDFRERSTHRNACCIIHLTHPTHRFPDTICQGFISLFRLSGCTLATHFLPLCLGVLFTPSDLWYSSSSLSHRPSTSLLYVLQLSLSRTTPYRYSVGD